MSKKAGRISDAELKNDDKSLAENILTPCELAFLTRTTAEVIARLVDLELIVPCAQQETLLFHAETVQRVCRIMRLSRHLQVSYDSMALVFDLLDRIDDLERRIRDLEKR